MDSHGQPITHRRSRCRRLAACLLLLLANPALALFELGDDQAVFRLLDAAAIHVDPGRQLSAERLLERPQDIAFRPYRDARDLQRMQDNWLRFQVRNNTGQPQTRILDFDVTLISELEFAYRTPAGETVHYRTGTEYPFLDRPIPYYRFHAFPLTVDPGVTQDVYVRINTAYLVPINPELVSVPAFQQRMQRAAAISHTFMGIMTGILVYLLFVMVHSREYPSFIHCCLFIGTGIATVYYFGGYTFPRLPDHAGLQHALYNTILSAFLMFYVLLLRRIYNTAQDYPCTNRLMVASAALSGASGIGFLLLPFSTLVLLLSILAFAIGLVCSSVSVYMQSQRHPFALPVLVGTLAFLVLSALSALGGMAFLPSSTFIRYGYEFGLTTQSLMLAFTISERIRHYRQEARALEEQAVLAATQATAKTDFLARMSHEIRTPMNGIIGMLDMLESTVLTDEQRKYLDITHNASNSLLRVINDILDYSKLEAGKVTLENIRFNPVREIRRIAGIIQPQAENRQLWFRLYFDDRIPQYLQGDPNRLAQILLNLLSNALKFTEHGEIRMEVTVQSQSADTIVLNFVISDTGIGISPEQQGQLFQAFTQADSRITRIYGGTGLGLTICKELSQLMGGHLRLSSQPGKGTSVQVSLPFRCCEATPDTSEVASGMFSVPNLSHLRVLLVEDNPINRQVIEHLLEAMKVLHEHADNGQQAVDCVREHGPFDAILMDCEMPLMDGFTATGLIRALEHDGRRHTPIIALTAHAIESYRQRCLDAGMDDYLAKPVRLQQLARMLQQWTRQDTA